VFLPFGPDSKTIVLAYYPSTLANIVSDRTRLEMGFYQKLPFEKNYQNIIKYPNLEMRNSFRLYKGKTEGATAALTIPSAV
jgi:hypothetical protein